MIVGAPYENSLAGAAYVASDPAAVSDQTITFGAIGAQAVYFPPMPVSATASSGLDVSFTTTTPGVCTSGGTNGASISFVAVGTCTVRSSQTGGLVFNPAPDVDQSFQVDRLPNVPSAVSAVASAPGQATVSWTAPPANGAPITEFLIEASPGKRACITKPSNSSCVIPNLMAGDYTFTVKARTFGGYSQASTPSSPITVITVPGAPTKTAASAGNGQVSVRWVAPDRDGATAITGYEVNVDGGGWQTATSPFVADGPALVPITVAVRAVNAVGPGRVISVTATPFGAPTAPSNVIATRVSPTKVRVSFDAAAGNGKPVKNYTVTASPGGRSCTNDATACTVTGLVAGTYTFTVTAKNVAGDSIPSVPSQPISVP